MNFGESRNYEYRSTEPLMREFKDSVIWIDMQAELNVWLTEIRDLLENDDLSMSEKETASLRGVAKAVRSMLSLPEILADNMVADKKADKAKKDKESEDGGN